MRIHLMLCGGLLAACGTNSHPADGDEAGGAADETPAGAGAVTPAEETPGETPTLVAVLLYEPAGCNDHLVTFFGLAVDASSNIVDPVDCLWDFGDGTTADQCRLQHSLPTPSNVSLTVHDPMSGGTGRWEEVVVGPESFDASLDVTGSGLTISWHAATRFGADIDPDSIQISIQPADKVVVTDPAVLTLADGTVTVTEAGTYTVTLDTSLSIGGFPTCSRHVERTIALSCPVPDPI